ncbi:MAG: hypothetical protein P4L40_05010 [Terracidiphilus sp.]|nr:hypothetical protein [Terracidiphilus sp.]
MLLLDEMQSCHARPESMSSIILAEGGRGVDQLVIAEWAVTRAQRAVRLRMLPGAQVKIAHTIYEMDEKTLRRLLRSSGRPFLLARANGTGFDPIR